MSIDISVVIWTVISFTALYYVLKYLLFKPIVSFMDDRNQRIKQAMQAGEEALEEKEENQRLMDDAVKDAHSKAKEILAGTKSADEEKRGAVLENARKLAKEHSKSIDALAKQDEQTDIYTLRNEMPELVYVLVGSLLQDKSAAEGCQSIIDAAVEQVYQKA